MKTSKRQQFDKIVDDLRAQGVTISIEEDKTSFATTFRAHIRSGQWRDYEVAALFVLTGPDDDDVLKVNYKCLTVHSPES